MVAVIRGRRRDPARVVAAQMGIHPDTVRHTIAEERNDWVERMQNRRDRVAAMRRDGATVPEIAAEMDMTEGAVRTMLHRIRRSGGLDDVPLFQRGKNAKRKARKGRTERLRTDAPNLIVAADAV